MVRKSTVLFGALAGFGAGVIAHDWYVINVEEPAGIVTTNHDHVHGYFPGAALVALGLAGVWLTA